MGCTWFWSQLERPFLLSNTYIHSETLQPHLSQMNARKYKNEYTICLNEKGEDSIGRYNNSQFL